MFKKAKRANLRRRNDSDDEEQEESLRPPLAPTLFGPVVAEVPFLETSGVSIAHSSTENRQSNGFLSSSNSVKSFKKEKKVKEIAQVQVPTKASLLSFDDDEGNRHQLA